MGVECVKYVCRKCHYTRIEEHNGDVCKVIEGKEPFKVILYSLGFDCETSGEILECPRCGAEEKYDPYSERKTCITKTLL